MTVRGAHEKLAHAVRFVSRRLQDNGFRDALGFRLDWPDGMGWKLATRTAPPQPPPFLTPAPVDSRYAASIPRLDLSSQPAWRYRVRSTWNWPSGSVVSIASGSASICGAANWCAAARVPCRRTDDPSSLSERAAHPPERRRFVDYLAQAFGDEPPWDRGASSTDAESRPSARAK